jgi:serine/threonine protein kinase
MSPVDRQPIYTEFGWIEFHYTYVYKVYSELTYTGCTTQYSRTEKAIMEQFADHPHIMSATEFVSSPDTFTIVMPRLPYLDLCDQMLHNVRFSLLDVVRIWHQVSLALEALHTAGFIHGDISLEQVIPRTCTDYVLADFGLSKRLVDILDWSNVYGVGKVDYMPPELMQRQPEYSDWHATLRAGDIYSLGKLVKIMVIYSGCVKTTGMMKFITQMLDIDPHNRPTTSDVVSRSQLFLQDLQALDPDHRLLVIRDNAQESEQAPQKQKTAQTTPTTPNRPGVPETPSVAEERQAPTPTGPMETARPTISPMPVQV